MELSDEHKQQIREEERHRLAEEQYREQVRRDLASDSKRSHLSITLLAIVVVIGAFIGGFFLLTKPSSEKQQGEKQLLSTNSNSAPSTTATKVNVASSASDKAGAKQKSVVVEKLTTAQIAERANPSVVVVEKFTENGEKVGQGSGYVYSSDGIVVTNYHVVRGAGSVGVKIPSSESIRVEHLVGYSIEHDIAAIQLSEAVSSRALETENAQLTKVGDHVVAIGAPLGLESTVSEGIVSAIRELGGLQVIQTTASISHGSSGGPLMNEYGKVIGLTTATVRDGQNLNFVVSARHITQLMSHRRIISFSDMLTETQVKIPIAVSTLSIPAQNIIRLPVNITGEQGAVLEGSYTVHGGMGNDVRVALVSADNSRVFLNSGLVKGEGQLKAVLPKGKYMLLFDNRMSMFSSKSVSPDLSLSYYK